MLRQEMVSLNYPNSGFSSKEKGGVGRASSKGRKGIAGPLGAPPPPQRKASPFSSYSEELDHRALAKIQVVSSYFYFPSHLCLHESFLG